MCRILSVSPAGFYDWLTRAPSARAIADERLMLNIRVAHDQSEETYGAPRIRHDLRDAGLAVGTKRVARLMRRAGLRGTPQPRAAPARPIRRTPTRWRLTCSIGSSASPGSVG